MEPLILLISPPLSFEAAYPLRLAGVATSLKHKGFRVVGIDLRRTGMKSKQKLKQPMQAIFKSVPSSDPVRLAVIDTSIRNVEQVITLIKSVKEFYGCPVAVIHDACDLDLVLTSRADASHLAHRLQTIAERAHFQAP